VGKKGSIDVQGCWEHASALGLAGDLAVGEKSSVNSISVEEGKNLRFPPPHLFKIPDFAPS